MAETKYGQQMCAEVISIFGMEIPFNTFWITFLVGAVFGTIALIVFVFKVILTEKIKS